MLKSGILNPDILHLLARIRHTNMLVIADQGFPYWPEVETVDISLVENVPTVLQVLEAVLANSDMGIAYMAEEFQGENLASTKKAFADALEGVAVTFEPHTILKEKVPQAIGLIRTGDLTQYANVILVSDRPADWVPPTRRTDQP